MKRRHSEQKRLSKLQVNRTVKWFEQTLSGLTVITGIVEWQNL